MNSNKSFDKILPHQLENIIFELNDSNIEKQVQETKDLFDKDFPYSFDLVICMLIYSAFKSMKGEPNIYISYLKFIEKFEENNFKIFDILSQYLLEQKSQESYYFLEKLLEYDLIDTNFVRNIQSLYFIHYKDKTEIDKIQDYQCDDNDNWYFIQEKFFKDFDKLSKNDWELHKQLIKEGVNPNEISKIIRNDEIEKLQEISSQNNFDFNQTIEPSLYERFSFINHFVRLIDYAAFFGSVKCFKYLLMNGANVNNAGKYAIAGGNLEIIHLCEQKHSLFQNFYPDEFEIAIEFHKYDIFNYLIENQNKIFKKKKSCTK